MSARGVAICAGALAACTSIPDFRPDNGVRWDPQGNGGTVVGTNFKLHFNEGTNVPFPDSFTYAGKELFGHAMQPSCATEDETGIAFYPATRLSPQGPQITTASGLTARMVGPAVVQIAVEWAAQLDCSGTDVMQPVGESRFNVFPDGHIVRFDSVTEDSDPNVTPDRCRCPDVTTTQDRFRITSFWTLPQVDNGHVYLHDGQDVTPSGFPVANGDWQGQSVMCVLQDDLELAFASNAPLGGRGRTPTGTETFAFVNDLAAPMPTLGNVAVHANTLFYPHPVPAEDTNCEAGRNFAEAFMSPTHLRVNSAAFEPAVYDGIIGGDSGSGPPGIVVEDTHVELSAVEGDVPPSFAVWLKFPHDVGAIRAKKNNMEVTDRPTPWYIPQRVNGREWIVWFADGIEGTNTFQIDGVE